MLLEESLQKGSKEAERREQMFVLGSFGDHCCLDPMGYYLSTTCLADSVQLGVLCTPCHSVIGRGLAIPGEGKCCLTSQARPMPLG